METLHNNNTCFFLAYLCLTIDDFPPSNSSFSFLSIIALDAKLAFLIDTCKL